MSNQISSQATKVWQTVSDSSTIDTYRKAVAVTWAILKETGLLIWFVVCLVLVAFDWFWTNSIYAGRRSRLWLETLNQSNSDNVAAEAGRALLAASKNTLTYTVAQAREQLGFPEKQEPTLNVPAPEPTKALPVAVDSSAHTPLVSKPPETTTSIKEPPATPTPTSTDETP